MIATLIIFGLILLIVGIIICICTKVRGLDFIFGVLGAYVLSGGVMMYDEGNKPTAMDVYQNKTTLEITYRDSIPVDSVVVFKDKEK